MVVLEVVLMLVVLLVSAVASLGPLMDVASLVLVLVLAMLFEVLMGLAGLPSILHQPLSSQAVLQPPAATLAACSCILTVGPSHLQSPCWTPYTPRRAVERRQQPLRCSRSSLTQCTRSGLDLPMFTPYMDVLTWHRSLLDI